VSRRGTLPVLSTARSKPILGFGPVGAACLPVFVVLIWVLVTGYDLRYQLMRVVCALAGPRAMYWLVGHWISMNFLALYAPVFGTVGLLYTLPALHLTPRHIRWWSYVIVVAWALSNAVVWETLVRSMSAGTLSSPRALVTSIAVVAAISAGILWSITRSWRVGLSVVAGTLGAWWVEHVQWPIWVVYLSPMIIWHTPVAGALIWWGLHQRLTQRPEWACGGCGYDLRGLTQDVCPECGRTRIPQAMASGN
jgi:hypothetical protein